MNRDTRPIPVTQFNGLFDRGSDDIVPPDHASICRNFVFTQNGPATRHGVEEILSADSIVRFVTYRRLNELSPRILYLDNEGNIFDSLDPLNPILSIEGMTDFASVEFFNRVYISPIEGDFGMANEFIYVYDGTSARLAAGNAPSGTLVVQNSVVSGNVDPGTHLFAIAFETESGYITVPGPALYGVVVAPGNLAVDLSDIPTGPAGTLARRILATRRIPNYNGDQNAYEFYFVPDGRIDNNTDTTATVNFYDADLLVSADYLFDQMPTIPAGLGLTVYQNRLVSWGEHDNPSVLRISKSNAPESIDAVSGLLVIDPTESGGVQNCVEFRDSLYITKSLRTYITTDDRVRDPVEWRVVTLDRGYGSGPNGIGDILDTRGPNTESFLAASKTGLMRFIGVYQDQPLSFKIDELWRTYAEDFLKFQVIVEPTRQLVFTLIDGRLFVADYRNGFSSESVRWAIWDFPFVINAIGMDVQGNDPRLLMSSGGTIYREDFNSTSDNGVAITTQFRSAPLTFDDTGFINVYTGVRLRARGTGTLDIRLFSEDNVSNVSLQPVTLSTTPGKEYFRLANFTNEKCAVDLLTASSGEKFNLNKIVLFGTVAWAERPNVE
jgi:hypothetical protein